ncbi:MAG: nucleotidyl transferase AbiEii/AbiGii toxin family protein [Krumholzibacteria bacterium]|nr:nucleotidyl transferase AbiEii/AbiGii toxin family protein [Candidatus Krumholzibacteria bacterium]
MKFGDIRHTVVTAIFSDDSLSGLLMLKGGNALELVHGVIHRGSLDIDLATPEDLGDAGEVERRLFAALRGGFGAAGFAVFDERFGPRPRVLGPSKPPTWGGYLAEFKLIARDDARRLGGDIGRMRREAQAIGPGQQRTFRIEISKFEYCAAGMAADVGGCVVRVYTLEMCALEKLRALCQQMDEYPYTAGARRPRARDFYDIQAIVERGNVDLGTAANLELCRAIFAAKDVLPDLLGMLAATREFHRPDWDQVRLTVPGRLMDFDYYFDYVVRLVVPKLQALWMK